MQTTLDVLSPYCIKVIRRWPSDGSSLGNDWTTGWFDSARFKSWPCATLCLLCRARPSISYHRRRRLSMFYYDDTVQSFDWLMSNIFTFFLFHLSLKESAKTLSFYNKEVTRLVHTLVDSSSSRRTTMATLQTRRSSSSRVCVSTHTSMVRPSSLFGERIIIKNKALYNYYSSI